MPSILWLNIAALYFAYAKVELMHQKFIYYILLFSLCVIGAWGLSYAFFNTRGDQYPEFAAPSSEAKTKDASHNKIGRASQLTAGNHGEGNQTSDDLTTAAKRLKLIQGYINNGQYQQLQDYINDHYSDFTSDHLEQIRQLYVNQGAALKAKGQLTSLRDLYRSQTNVFNDLSAWTKLADVNIELRDWQNAFNAALTASLLENDSVTLEKVQFDLVKIAANLRAKLESQKDEIGINQLYKELYQAHPNYPRYQLELAYSYIRLEQFDNALPLLEQLQYDLELGEVSQQVLAKLQNQNNAPQEKNTETSNTNSREISVPLQRYGTNLIAQVGINRKTLNLLLDTGASITAIDNRIVERLGLSPTGQIIQLSTANGIREARLYRVKQLQLGRFNLANHVIAGIDLGGDGQRFSGLLGTDLLNRLNPRYSYLIDNDQQALIFRPKTESR